MKEKVKTISKYVVNTMNMLNAILLSLAPIWDWNVEKISNTLIAVAGIISVYLTGNKLFDLNDKKDK